MFSLDEDTLWDEVHLCKAIVPAFVKKLKDVALDRNTARQSATPKGWHPTNRRGQQWLQSHNRGYSAPPKQPNAFRGHSNRPQSNPPISGQIIVCGGLNARTGQTPLTRREINTSLELETSHPHYAPPDLTITKQKQPWITILEALSFAGSTLYTINGRFRGLIW